MNAAVFLCPTSQISELALNDYDVVLGPESGSHPKTMHALEFKKIVATTSESLLEASILRRELDRIFESLEGMFDEGSASIIKRGLYLSPLKNDLRLLINAKDKLLGMTSPSTINVDVYYTYLTFPELFAHEPFVVKWFHCPRIARGRLSFLFKLLEKLRPSSYTQSYL